MSSYHKGPFFAKFAPCRHAARWQGAPFSARPPVCGLAGARSLRGRCFSRGGAPGKTDMILFAAKAANSARLFDLSPRTARAVLILDSSDSLDRRFVLIF